MSQRNWLFVASGTLVASLVFLGLVVYFDNESDKVGVEFEPTMEAAIDDLEEFWSSLLDELGYGNAYNSPDVHYFSPGESESTPCGDTVPDQAFFCGGDNTIYVDEDFLERMFTDYGAYAPIFILSHEWGHSVQNSLGILQAPSFDIQVGLQADCFAGMYSRDLDERDLITDEDLRQAIAALILRADPVALPWWAPTAQGDPQQRVTAFTAGYDEGWLTCTREPFLEPQVEPESG